jgi:hypothetical protein
MDMGAEGESGHVPSDPDRPAVERLAFLRVLTQIERLVDLRNDGMLTDDEFEAVKARLLRGES